MAGIGIVGYGAAIPRFRITVDEIARVWRQDPNQIRNGLNVQEKSVPDKDEDTITLSVLAATHAMARAGIGSQRVGALYVGSESHPYVVKPSGTVVAEALGLPRRLMVADLEFACKAGTAAIQCCYGLAKAGVIDCGLAIGADTAQGRPGDALEYTAAAGAAAFIIGKDPLATLDHTLSYTSDTSDFWRREGEGYPRHGARFTGKPAYFTHVLAASRLLLEQTGHSPADFAHAVFHMPNGKFPAKAAETLGFTKDQIKTGFVVTRMGNCYSGSSPVGLTAVLDVAKPGDKIFLTSYGSGAGSDSFIFTVTDAILARRDKAPKTEDFLNRKRYVDYATYARLRGKLKE